MRRLLPVLVLATVLPGAAPAAAQSVLERSPNLQGVWTLPRGQAAMVFVHRFEFLSGGDELFNIPTLTAAVGLPLGLTLGLDFTSNSEIVEEKLAGNETQYWLKRGVRVTRAAALAGQVAYNTAAESWDGALGARLELRAVQLFGELRGFSDLFGTGEAGAAGAVGAALQVTPYLGVTGDVGQVFGDRAEGTPWSAGLSFAIPGSPHTMSLQATNSGAVTLQGASREKRLGPESTRYGFVFTVPLGSGSNWLRIFRPGPRPAPPADTVDARVEIRMVAFQPREIRIRAGQTVEWVNLDPIEHTATADDGSWDSGTLAEGQRYVRRFTAPGRFTYHCTPHPQMTGVVIVE